MSKNSEMPDGGYNPQLGSNYMMDRFDFDSEYGEGVDSARKDPDPNLPRSNHGLSTMPDGFLGVDPTEAFDFRMLQAMDGDAGMGDISGMIREATPLNNLSWLEGAEQDPDRLPENVNLVEHTQNMMGQTVFSDEPESGTRSELESAWGVHRRTNGQGIVPNIQYPRPVTGPTSSIPGDQFRDIVAHAMRRSAFGVDFGTISQEVLQLLGNSALSQESPVFKRLASALRAVKAEHGLAGNVYVRDSAFPSVLSGKWDKSIKSRCASARYFLTSPGSKLSSHERYLGKLVVTEIPWAEAAEHYRPILAAQGKRLASGDVKKALAAAFLNVEARQHTATNFPTMPVNTVSSKQARKAFSEMEKVAAPVVKLASQKQAFQKKADARIERWVAAGLLSVEAATQMRSRISDPYKLYRVAAKMVAKATSEVYKGPVFTTHQSQKTSSESNPLEVRGLLRWASKQMSEGAAGKDLNYLLKARFSSDLLKQAQDQLVPLRKKHEGLAGHLYVEASAYASVNGASGCEKGALVHRANQIKAVMGMDRCTSCASNSEGVCKTYNKVLVDSAPTSNPEKYASEMIRLANSDDERTASLFAPSFDASEYNLQNDNLDTMDFNNAASHEEVGNIFFDGMILGDEF